MIANTIYVRATRAAVRSAISGIPQEARAGGATANAMMIRCGFTALGLISRAFVVKSLGGTDEAGDSWVPLKPTTIAYSRRHIKKPGDTKESRVFSRAKVMPWIPKARIRAGYAPSYALTRKQNDRWWDVYRQGLVMFKGNKGHAAARAWVILKSEGATTLMAQYGNAKVKILNSTGLLLSTLEPGSKSSGQVFRVGPGEVIVGTSRRWAGVHHCGSRNGRVPQRRLWPEPRRWPSSWWLDIAEQARAGLVDIAVSLITGGART